MLKRLKRIRSHTGHAHFIAECDADAVGKIPRQVDIPSPYAYSPDWHVWFHEILGSVVIIETSHRCFDVFEVPRDMIEPIIEPERDTGEP